MLKIEAKVPLVRLQTCTLVFHPASADSATSAGASQIKRRPAGGRPAVSLSFQVAPSADIPINPSGTSEAKSVIPKRTSLRPSSALPTMRDVADHKRNVSTPFGDHGAHNKVNSKCQALVKKPTQLQKTKLLLHPPAEISDGFYERSNAPARPSSAPPVHPQDLADSRRLKNSVAKLRSLAINSGRPLSNAWGQRSMLSDIADEFSGLYSTSNLRDGSAAWDDNAGYV